MQIKCKKCDSENIKKDGKSRGDQRYQCKECNHKFTDKPASIKYDNALPEFTEVMEKSQTIQMLSATILTEEDLIKLHNVDMDRWKTFKFRCGRWGNPEKGLWQSRAEFTLKDKSEIDTEKLLETFIIKAKEYSPKVNKIKYKKQKKGKLLEIGPVDQHLSQLSWGRESGADYDINIASELYNNAVEYIGSQASTVYNIDKILYIIGHDFFNSDDTEHATTRGTSQDEDSRWTKSFYVGCDAVIQAVNFLKQIAPVDIKVILGNHDRQKSFYMGAYVQAWFKNDKNINVDNNPTIRKYYEYGQNMFGMAHHGKDERLAMNMPLEEPKMWARTKYRTIRKGHVHHESKKMPLLDTEVSGIKITTLSTLVALDAWHCEMGYNSMRQSQGFIHDKEKGNIAEFKYTI